jgi:hypothetical protein
MQYFYFWKDTYVTPLVICCVHEFRFTNSKCVLSAMDSSTLTIIRIEDQNGADICNKNSIDCLILCNEGSLPVLNILLIKWYYCVSKLKINHAYITSSPSLVSLFCIVLHASVYVWKQCTVIKLFYLSIYSPL